MYDTVCNSIVGIYILSLIIVLNKGFTETCVNIIATQDSQFIYSHPEFTSRGTYPSNTDTCWVLHADPDVFGQQVRIQLKIVHFDLETSDNCSFDYLEIYHGQHSDTGSELVNRYCGSDVSLDVVSNGYYFYMRFVSDGEKQEHGFKLVYKAVLVNNSTISPVLVNGCSYLEAENDGQQLYSHAAFPNNYESLYDACWIIHASPNAQVPMYYGSWLGVQIRTGIFLLEYGSACTRDYLAIYNGTSNVTSPLIGRFCGGSTFTINATNPYMFLHFHSDRSETFFGFSLVYQTVAVSLDNEVLLMPPNCMYLEATDDKQYFTSHSEYGGGTYYSTLNFDTCWAIFVATNRSNDVVQVKSKGFKLYIFSGDSCLASTDDNLAFYDGINGPLLGRYCNATFHNQASDKKIMVVKFNNFCCFSSYGFRLEYFAVDRSLADNRNHFPLEGWKIALIIIGAILACAIGLTFFVVLYNWAKLEKWWSNRKACRCTNSVADTEDEVEGPCEMNVIPSSTTVTHTPTSNTHSKAAQISRFKKKKTNISADRYRSSDSDSEEEEDDDRPPKKLKNKRQRKVQDTSEINVTVDPPPYATDIENDPPPPYPTALSHIYM